MISKISLKSPFIILAFSLAIVWERPVYSQCEQSRLVSSDASVNDYAGMAVALRGDLAVIGAPNSNGEVGSAYVYRWDGTDWLEEQKLTATDSVPGDRFGTAVSVDGDWIAISASADQEAGYNTGAAYLFRWDGAVWVEAQKLMASDLEAGDLFGQSLSMDGSWLAIGAPGEDDSGLSAGAAYVFRRDGEQWNEVAKLRASQGIAFDEFGTSLSLRGDVIMIGAPGQEIFVGAAYVFGWDGVDWAEAQVLSPSDLGGEFAGFGFASAFDGDTAVFGAPLSSSGCAFVFRLSGSTWEEQAILVPDDAESGDFFGGAVAASGDNVLVGATGDGPLRGSASHYRFDGADWVEQTTLEASDRGSSDRFGYAVAMDERAAIVAAPWWDGPRNTGASYVFAMDAVLGMWSNYGVGWPGTSGVPSLVVNTPPVIGSTVEIEVENSQAPNPTTGALLMGTASAQLDTSLDGTLLVTPTWVFPLSIPAATLTLTGDIPDDPSISGLTLYLQVLMSDLGASQGVSFTPGLEVQFGDC